MSPVAVIFMMVICTVVWGGFSGLLIYAIRRERSKADIIAAEPIEELSNGGSTAGTNMGSGVGPSTFGFLAVLSAVAGTNGGGRMLGFLEPWETASFGYSLNWLMGATVLGGIAALIYMYQVKNTQEEENRRTSDASLPLVLLLRPFAVDEMVRVVNPHRRDYVLFPAHIYEPVDIPIERLFAEALKPHMQLQAIGGEPTGPGVVQATDSDWRDRFLELARRAVGIIVIPLPGEGVIWECKQLRDNGYLGKTVFLTPPYDGFSVEFSLAIDEFRKQLKDHGFELPGCHGPMTMTRLSGTGALLNQQAFDASSHASILKALKAAGQWPAETTP